MQTAGPKVRPQRIQKRNTTDLVRPAAVPFTPDMETGRAETVGAGHRMASAARTAPKAGAAAFRNLDRQIGRRSDRRRQNGRAGRRREAKSQYCTKSDCTYHRLLPRFYRLSNNSSSPIQKTGAVGTYRSNMTKTMKEGYQLFIGRSSRVFLSLGALQNRGE